MANTGSQGKFQVNVKEFGASGSNQETTGSIAAGQTLLTVAGAIDFEVGQGIAIAKAGVGGNTPHVTTIVAINGTDLTLADPALSSVTDTPVRHDDGQTIQDAIDALPISGSINYSGGKTGTVYLPPGNYCIRTPIRIRAGMILQGAGQDATVIVNWTYTQDSIQSDLATDRNGCRIVIRDLSIQGSDDQTNCTAGNGINIENTTDAGTSFLIENVLVFGHFNGIRFKNALGAQIRYVQVFRTGNDGIVAAGFTSPDSFSTTVTIQDTYVHECKRHGYYFLGTYCSFVNTASDSNGGDGYHFYRDGTSYNTCVTLVGCGSESNLGYGMYFDHGFGISLIGCYIILAGHANVPSDALHMTNVNQILLTNVMAKTIVDGTATRYGFNRQSCTSTTIIGGEFTGDPNDSAHAINNFDVLMAYVGDGAMRIGASLQIKGQQELWARTPTPITADQKDYDLGSGTFFRISSDATRTITGFAGGTNGRVLEIVNVGNFGITLTNLDTSSADANQIITGTQGSIRLSPSGSVRLIYDDVSMKWRVISR